MKGKGKKCRDSEEESPVSPFAFEPLDTVRHCPRFTTIIGRSEEEGVGLEDLDALQAELETLLVSVVKRQRLLEDERESLVNVEKSKDKKIVKGQSSLKRTKVKQEPDERPSKKIKESSNSSTASSPVSFSNKRETSKSKSKKLASKAQDYGYDVSSQHYRNDIPDRFYRFIEPYCAPTKPEHVKMLEEMLKSYDEDSDVYKVPNLGKHYTLKWAYLDDSLEAKKVSPRSMEKKKGLSPANSSTATPEKGRNGKRQTKEKNETEKGGFGLFTQRLISCLMEEENGNVNNDEDESESETPNKSNGSPLKPMNLGNAAQLEKRLKKELEENGFLDFDDVTDMQPVDDDEILRELTRCQNELRLVQSYNQSQLKLLLTHAKTDLSKQEIKKKLQVTDGEVNEIYRRFVQAKQKKKLITKKEKEQAVKALKDRESLVRQLDSLQSV
ncbi:Transcriptional adapter 3 [Halotydeus destructor]|nr:Transcriptional adapter 3 [Halotydeus destructor]